MAQSASVVGGKFSCGACGKQYTWKPHLAGKKAKCACGAAITVPAAHAAASPAPSRPPPAAPAPAAADDDLYDFASPPPAPAPRVAPSLSQPERSTAAPKPVAGGSAWVVPQSAAAAYPATRSSAVATAPAAARDRESQIHDIRRDLFLPLGLIAAGFIGMLVWAVTAADAGAAGAVVVSLAVGVATVVKTFVIILLALVAAPMFGISFGDFRTAIAKFAAVIIFTDMGLLWLDEIMDAVAGEATGRGARRVSWLVTLLFASTLVSLMLRFLFDMDSEEVGYVAAPLVIASLVIGWFLKLIAVGILMGLMGAADGAADDSPSPVERAGGRGSSVTAIEKDASPDADSAAPEDAAPEGDASTPQPADASSAAPVEQRIQYKETLQDREIARKVRTPAFAEAREWQERHAGNDDALTKLITSLYSAGAKHVYIDLTSGPTRPAKAYAELPTQPSQRTRCLAAYRLYCRTHSLQADPEAVADSKQRFLVMELRR